jgi:hypothetical protein
MKHIVFISYCHKDKAWKDSLVRNLSVSLCAERVELWGDWRVHNTDNWYEEISSAMERASVAICLISPNYLSSDYVRNEEIPYLVERVENLLLLLVMLCPCRLDGIPWLEHIPILPSHGKSLLHDYQHREIVIWSKISMMIKQRIDDPEFVQKPKPPRWPELCGDRVSVGRLQTTRKDVFGRSNELEFLYRSWDQQTPRVVILAGPSGTGKTALVGKWLNLMRRDNYRGAQRVYAFSFNAPGRNVDTVSSHSFVSQALRWFGDDSAVTRYSSPQGRGRHLAELVQRERVLLVFDGIDSFQTVVSHNHGEITDLAIRTLLTCLRRHNPGLCVLTTRRGIATGKGFENVWLQMNLNHISIQAGRALLHVSGVSSSDKVTENVVRSFGNHALAINLLAGYLLELSKADLYEALCVPYPAEAEAEEAPVIRILSAIEKALSRSPEAEVIRLLSLFDRPVTLDEIFALHEVPKMDTTARMLERFDGIWEYGTLFYTPPKRSEYPDVKGQTSHLAKLSREGFLAIVERLRRANLVLPAGCSDSQEIDVHHAIREYFRSRLRSADPRGWRELNSRLCDYYRALSVNRYPETVEEMTPLFEALSYGCRARRHKEVLEEIYEQRIQRIGWDNWYCTKKLGAIDADLAALSQFFDVPWRTPSPCLWKWQPAYVLGEVGFRLFCLGRLSDAMQPASDGLQEYVRWECWGGASICASLVSAIQLALGYIRASRDSARQAIALADKSGDFFLRVTSRTGLADIDHHAGRLNEAKKSLRSAESIQKSAAPSGVLGYSMQAYRICDILLSDGNFSEVLERSPAMIRWAEYNNIALDMGLSQTVLSQAQFQEVMTPCENECIRDVSTALDSMNLAVEHLRKSSDQFYLARGLLVRSELHRVMREYPRSQCDLDEAFSIAVASGSMLLKCDAHLECSRLLLKILDEGGSLDKNYFFPDGPFVLYNAVAEPLGAARAHLGIAETIASETGYHRRDPEILITSCEIEMFEGDYDNAMRRLRQAEDAIVKTGIKRWTKAISNLYRTLDGLSD